MRTTVTLDADTAALIRKAMERREVSFKQALNDAVRAGLIPAQRQQPGRTSTFGMGEPAVALDKALAVAAELEDNEVLRELDTRK